jgi:CMP-2-keto-3-deoxyoctulosonic acid synthetase
LVRIFSVCALNVCKDALAKKQENVINVLTDLESMIFKLVINVKIIAYAKNLELVTHVYLDTEKQMKRIQIVPHVVKIVCALKLMNVTLAYQDSDS